MQFNEVIQKFLAGILTTFPTNMLGFDIIVIKLEKNRYIDSSRLLLFLCVFFKLFFKLPQHFADSNVHIFSKPSIISLGELLNFAISRNIPFLIF